MAAYCHNQARARALCRAKSASLRAGQRVAAKKSVDRDRARPRTGLSTARPLAVELRTETCRQGHEQRDERVPRTSCARENASRTLVATTSRRRGLDLTGSSPHVHQLSATTPPRVPRRQGLRRTRVGSHGKTEPAAVEARITLVLPRAAGRRRSRVASASAIASSSSAKACASAKARSSCTRAGAAAGHAGRTGSTSSVSPSRPTIRTMSPASAPASQRARQISPRTRTSPSGRQALRTATSRPDQRLHADLGRIAAVTTRGRRAPSPAPRAPPPITATRFQGVGSTKSASARAMMSAHVTDRRPRRQCAIP